MCQTLLLKFPLESVSWLYLGLYLGSVTIVDIYRLMLSSLLYLYASFVAVVYHRYSFANIHLHVPPLPVLSCLAPSCPALPRPVLSFFLHIQPCPVLPCPAVTCPACPVLPLSWRVLSNPALPKFCPPLSSSSCPVLPLPALPASPALFPALRLPCPALPCLPQPGALLQSCGAGASIRAGPPATPQPQPPPARPTAVSSLAYLWAPLYRPAACQLAACPVSMGLLMGAMSQAGRLRWGGDRQLQSGTGAGGWGGQAPEGQSVLK